MSHCEGPSGLGMGSLAIPLAIFIVAPLAHLLLFDHFLPQSFGSRSTLITGGFYALLVLWMLAAAMANRPYDRFRIDQVDVLFLIFLTGIGVSAALYGYNPWLKYVPFFMVAPYFAARLLDSREFSIFFTALVALCIVAATLVSFEITDTFGRSLHRSLVLVFGYDHGGGVASNVLGILLVLTVAYLAYPRAHRLTATVWAAILLLPWLVALLVDLQFRAALYGALLISAGLIILSKANLRVRLVLVAYLCSSVIVSVMLLTHSSPQFLLAPITENISSLNNKSSSLTSSVHHRKVFIVIAAQEFIDNPVAGIGAGRFAEVTGIAGAYPHNSLLQSFTELGVIGGGLYLGIALLLFWRLFGLVSDGLNEKGKWAWYVLGLWTYLFILEFVGGSYLMSASYWLISGLAVSLIKSSAEMVEPFRAQAEANRVPNKSENRT